MFKDGDFFNFDSVSIKDLMCLLPNKRGIAIQKGLSFYFTNRKCFQGHLSFQQVNYGCIECHLYRRPSEKISIEERRNIIIKRIKIDYYFNANTLDVIFTDDLLDYPSTIDEAKSLGVSKFFPRKPCISKGHIAPRSIYGNQSYCTLCTKNWETENYGRLLERRRVFEEKNKEERNEKRKVGRRRTSFKLKRNEQRRNRYKTDENYRLTEILRSRITAFITGKRKSAKTEDLIGCDLDDLKDYLESKFSEGMTWNNHGDGPNDWHIDHIIPVSVYDLNDPKQQKECFNYKNLQPLWKYENLSKGGTNRVEFKKKKQKKVKV